MELKITVERESDVYTNCNWCFMYNTEMIIKGSGELGKKRMSGGHPNYYTIEIGQNTEKSSGDLKRLALNQTSVKYHQLKLMWKTPKE